MDGITTQFNFLISQSGPICQKKLIAGVSQTSCEASEFWNYSGIILQYWKGFHDFDANKIFKQYIELMLKDIQILTSFTDKNSKRGNTKWRSKYWPIFVVRSNSAMLGVLLSQNYISHKSMRYCPIDHCENFCLLTARSNLVKTILLKVY